MQQIIYILYFVLHVKMFPAFSRLLQRLENSYFSSGCMCFWICDFCT